MRFRTKAREKVGTKEQDRNQGQYKRAVRRHDGGQAKTVVKEEGREKGWFRMGVRNRKRSGQNEDRNEDSGKQHRFGGRGMAGGKRESLKVMGQDGVQESGGDLREKVQKSEVVNQDRPGSDWSLADKT